MEYGNIIIIHAYITLKVKPKSVSSLLTHKNNFIILQVAKENGLKVKRCVNKTIYFTTIVYSDIRNLYWATVYLDKSITFILFLLFFFLYMDNV